MGDSEPNVKRPWTPKASLGRFEVSGSLDCPSERSEKDRAEANVSELPAEPGEG